MATKLNKSLVVRRRGGWLRALHPDRSPLPFLIPTLLFLLLFLAYPIGKVVYQAFFHNVLIRPAEGTPFVGLQNFIDMFSSGSFWRSFRITVLWTLLSVSGKIVIGFTAAALLQNPFRGCRIYLTLLMIPWVTPVVVAAVAWRWVLDGQFGQLNGLLQAVHILSQPFSFLGHQLSAFIATASVDMWVGIPFIAMVMMAGLQAIPGELYEAGRIDGAGGLAMFRHITLPMVRPILLVAALLSGVWTFNSFQVIFPLTRGGPAGATETLVVRTYDIGFGSFNFGMASALATFIFVFLMLVSYAYWRLLNRGS